MLERPARGSCSTHRRHGRRPQRGLLDQGDAR
jgi:hypothetical protein